MTTVKSTFVHATFVLETIVLYFKLLPNFKGNDFFKLLCIFIQVELQEKIRMYMSKSLTARSNSLRR